MQIIEVWKPSRYASRILQQKEFAAELRASNAGKHLLRLSDGAFSEFYRFYHIFMKKMLPFASLQGLLSPLQTVMMLAYIILFVIDGDINQIGLYVSLTAAATALSGNLTGLYGNVNNLLRSTLYGERISLFYEAKSDIELPRVGALSPPDGVYALELRDVSFRYDNADFCIEHLNLQIHPGERIAIVGENGAGKTTLIKLLLRLYDVTDGALILNGTNVKDFDVHALRLRIGVAFQDVRIFATTLRDYLTSYRDISDVTCFEVMHQMGLDDMISSKSGLDTPLSREFHSEGIVLSGGEAQRLALARLLAGDFGLILLDEPSAALDPLAESRLMQTILDASHTATTVMIAHRLSTVRDFDMIYYMEDGEIIERGTHDALIEEKGNYCKMFQLQAEKYQA